MTASAVAFGSLHGFIRHGPPYRRMQRYFERNQAASEQADKKRQEEPSVLAAQAGARLLNDVHNIIVVRAALQNKRCISATSRLLVLCRQATHLLAQALFAAVTSLQPDLAVRCAGSASDPGSLSEGAHQ